MVTLTNEQVRTLAPDASAARAGQGLADARRWSLLGRSESAAWGLCQGSGSSPYQVAVDLTGPAYRCSCPSRKIPCKHALGLLFLLADAGLSTADHPNWVTGWLDSRVSRAERAAARPQGAATADPAARARRIESRERKIVAGIDELERWLADLVRRGLDSARSEGYRFWDEMGARLVDAQAAGLGRSVRALGSIASAGDAWPHHLLERTARLQLLCSAYRRLDSLSDLLRADVRAHVGWTIKEDELNPTDSVEDRWLVVGRRVDDTGQVIAARMYLVGEHSRRFALHLAFGVDAAPPTPLAVTGQAFRATVTFYPSATPLRVAVRPVLRPDGEVSAIPEPIRATDLVRRHAELLGQNPFLEAFPAAIGPVVPVLRDGALVLRDGGVAVPVLASGVAPTLLAVSGGHPVTVVGEWDGGAFRPLSVCAEGCLVALDTSSEVALIAGASDPTWSALVSGALLGTERSGAEVPLPEPVAALVETDGRTAEQRLLVAAGVLALRRRAGRQPTAAPEEPPTPAGDDPRSAITGAAARLVSEAVRDHPALVPELLGLIRSSRRRLPAESLPELLSAARDDPDLGAPVVELAGPRAAWLAAQIPEVAGGLPIDVSDPDATWEAASDRRERATVVAALRRADPAGGREALRRWLPDAAGEERAALVEALQIGLGPDDEAFLAAVLDDRRADVRRTAAGLLATIETSQLSRLVEVRTRPLLSIRGRLRRTLKVELPQLDAELERAGFGGRASAGMGQRGSLLRQLVSHVPPWRWPAWLDIEREGLIAAAGRSNEGAPILQGWMEASVRFGDMEWLAAILSDDRALEATQADARGHVARLPNAVRREVAAAVAASVGPSELAWLAAFSPAPWPAPLADAVIDNARRLDQEQYPGRELHDLVRAAAIGLPVERADDLVGSNRPALASAFATLNLRTRLHAAFADMKEPR